ncbi:MAG: hypothetical protein M3464_05420 [Chloroflexota bacterium]|nr:hypothetical protein [Chloroflexota bacterium]
MKLGVEAVGHPFDVERLVPAPGDRLQRGLRRDVQLVQQLHLIAGRPGQVDFRPHGAERAVDPLPRVDNLNRLDLIRAVRLQAAIDQQDQEAGGRAISVDQRPGQAAAVALAGGGLLRPVVQHREKKRRLAAARKRFAPDLVERAEPIAQGVRQLGGVTRWNQIGGVLDRREPELAGKGSG